MSASEKNRDVSNRELAELMRSQAEVVRSLQARLDEYERQPSRPTRIARGTPKPERKKPVTVADKIVEVLIGIPKTTEDLSKAVGASVETVEHELERLETQEKVTRLSRGGNLYRWALRAGKEADLTVRRAVIVGLLMHEPLETYELLQILGLREVPGATPAIKHVEDRKRIENDIIEIRRNEPVWWMNKTSGGGKGRSNIYWISPDRKEPPSEFDGRIARKKR